MEFTNIFYVLASVLFILGIKKLSHPKTARNGNMISFIGMMIAIVATLFAKYEFEIDFQLIATGIIIGIIIGATFAIKVKMTQMPQMVAILNGFGGGASALVAAAEFLKFGELTTFTLSIIILSILISHSIACQSLISDSEEKLRVSSNKESSPYTIKHLYSLNIFLYDSQKVIFTPEPFYLPLNQIDTTKFPLSAFKVSVKGDTTIYNCSRGYVELAYNKEIQLYHLKVSLYPDRPYTLLFEYKNERIFRTAEMY